ncbi:MAG: hypothetical protein MJ252_07115 [archaeon]|nr:hypothetical protein [archaeon]
MDDNLDLKFSEMNLGGDNLNEGNIPQNKTHNEQIEKPTMHGRSYANATPELPFLNLKTENISNQSNFIPIPNSEKEEEIPSNIQTNKTNTISDFFSNSPTNDFSEQNMMMYGMRNINNTFPNQNEQLNSNFNERYYQMLIMNQMNNSMPGLNQYQLYNQQMNPYKYDYYQQNPMNYYDNGNYQQNPIYNQFNMNNQFHNNNMTMNINMNINNPIPGNFKGNQKNNQSQFGYKRGGYQNKKGRKNQQNAYYYNPSNIPSNINKGEGFQSYSKSINTINKAQANQEIIRPEKLLPVSLIAPKIQEFTRRMDGISQIIFNYKELPLGDPNKNILKSNLIPLLYNLSKENPGYILVQNFIDCLDENEVEEVFKVFYGYLSELSFHTNGCRIVQKIIEYGNVKYMQQVTQELKGEIIKCIQDQNGNHVIQKLIENFPKGYHKELLGEIKGNISILSTHQYGCRAIQRIFEYCEISDIEFVLDEITPKIELLCNDQFGNYVIQNVVEKVPHKRDIVLQRLKGKILDFSLHKFASNVVEKCLSCGTQKEIEIIIREILDDDSKNEGKVLVSLAMSKFGNYVLQKMIEKSQGPLQNELIAKIKNTSIMNKESFAWHVVNLINSIESQKSYHHHY